MLSTVQDLNPIQPNNLLFIKKYGHGQRPLGRCINNKKLSIKQKPYTVSFKE